MYDRKEMFKAVCSECGNDCEVPFKPTGSKPVLCSACFSQGGNSRSDRRDNRRSDRRERRSFDRGGDRQMFQATCDECGDKCEVPFRPTAGKPIYCDKCFGKKSDRGDRRGGGDRDRRSSGGGNNQSSKVFDTLNSKLDRIINLLEAGNVKKTKSKIDAVLKESPKKEKTNVSAPLDLGTDKKDKPAKKNVKVKAIPKKTVAKKSAKKKK